MRFHRVDEFRNVPHPRAGDDDHDHQRDARNDLVLRVGLALHLVLEQNAEVNRDEMMRKGNDRGDGEHPEPHSACCEDCGGEVWR